MFPSYWARGRLVGIESKRSIEDVSLCRSILFLLISALLPILSPLFLAHECISLYILSSLDPNELPSSTLLSSSSLPPRSRPRQLSTPPPPRPRPPPTPPPPPSPSLLIWIITIHVILMLNRWISYWFDCVDLFNRRSVRTMQFVWWL